MLGETVRETRIRKGLTQARLARLAGVSRRHLAALEKGANVSILVLRKVAFVLELTEIQLGAGLTVHTGPDGAPAAASVNVPLLTDTLREARAGSLRAETMIARAEGLLAGGHATGATVVADTPAHPPTAIVPPAPVWHVERQGAALRDGATWIEVRTAGEIRPGVAIDEQKKETVVVPSDAIEKGEIVLRARGSDMAAVGIHEGDLLVAQLRPRGRAATAELVIAKTGNAVLVGRWWAKNGKRALVTDQRDAIESGRKAIKVVAAVTAILRG
jgi:transcriptional regulator with XRE-family HTH domain